MDLGGSFGDKMLKVVSFDIVFVRIEVLIFVEEIEVSTLVDIL